MYPAVNNHYETLQELLGLSYESYIYRFLSRILMHYTKHIDTSIEKYEA